jgi:hypothetical protein
VSPDTYPATIRPIRAAASCEIGFMFPPRPGVCRVVIYSL